jgi:hypothetical protein
VHGRQTGEVGVNSHDSGFFALPDFCIARAMAMTVWLWM